MKNTSEKVKARKYLYELFSRAAKHDSEYRTEIKERDYQRELVQQGARNFKRRALGLCGSESTKTLDGVAELLLETKIAGTIVEARNLVTGIVSANVISNKGIPLGYGKYLLFQKIKNSDEYEKYRITVRNETENFSSGL